MRLPTLATYFLDLKEDEEYFNNGEVQELPEVVVNSTTKIKEENALAKFLGAILDIGFIALIIIIIKKLFK